MNIHIINGPNLNLLGKRQPEIYGHATLEDLQSYVTQKTQHLGVSLSFLQSNIEGEIINAIQACMQGVDALVINPGAYTHYSYGIFDALSCLSIPVVEVHISNIHKREAFRHVSVTAPAAMGQICGLGFEGYVLAVTYLAGQKA